MLRDYKQIDQLEVVFLSLKRTNYSCCEETTESEEIEQREDTLEGPKW
jgi:hypothetical protein